MSLNLSNDQQYPLHTTHLDSYAFSRSLVLSLLPCSIHGVMIDFIPLGRILLTYGR